MTEPIPNTQHPATAGRLIAVGLGPGDPELITVKGLRRLQSADIVVVPRAAGADDSQAERIAAPWLDPARQRLITLNFTLEMARVALDGMWDGAVEVLAEPLLSGRQVVYLVVGDPLLFGSFVYLWERLALRLPQIPVEIIPGISSVNASAAAAGVPVALGSERVALLPAAHEADSATLRRLLADFDTVILLKAGRALRRLLPILETEGLLPHTMVVEQASWPTQRVFRDVHAAANQRLSYWTLLIIRRSRRQSCTLPPASGSCAG
ncbi:MAG: precorrin-2 C(20)-methyltransferase [Ardenticatenaceae bacterium]|nr:precorrin-2 C(20)-methyltransferase [Ardenticatenaceae bacterium]